MINRNHFRLDLESILSEKENEIPERNTRPSFDFERVLSAADARADDGLDDSDGSFAKPSVINFGNEPRPPTSQVRGCRFYSRAA